MWKIGFTVIGMAVQALSAPLIQFEEKPLQTIEISEQKVFIYSNGTLSAAGKKTPLFLSGYGVRTKKVIVVKVKAYLMAHYLDTPEKLSPIDGVEKIKQAKVKAFVMTFLRDIPREKILNSFNEALEKNAVDISESKIAALIQKLSVDYSQGSTLTVISVSDSGTDTVFFDSQTTQGQETGPDLGNRLWLAWFGKPVDSGIESLQPYLLGKPFVP